MKRAIALIIGIAVSVFLFARSMAGTSMEGLRVAFQSANYLTLPLMLMLLFGFYWLKAMRWKWLLAPVCPLTTRQLFKPLLIGFAFNNLLPAHLGEFVRVFVVRTRHGVPASTVLSTVVLERIFDVVAILALFSLGLLFTDDMPQEYRDNALIFAGFCVVGVLCVAAYLIWTDWFLKLSETMMGWVLPKAISAKILEMLQAGAHGLHALKSGKAIFLIAVSSLAQWTLNGLIAYTALKAFHVPVTISAGMIITGVTAMGVTIPSTPGYFGVIQYCFRISMVAQGIPFDPSQVMAASVYYHMSMYIPVPLLGLYYMASMKVKFSDITKAADADELEEVAHAAADEDFADNPNAPAAQHTDGAS